MPCYQVRTTQLEAPAANLDVMAAALRALGLNVEAVNLQKRRIHVGGGVWQNGRLEIRGELPFDAMALRREYSKQSIKATAKAKGWQVRFQKDTAHVVRRRFA
jgi:hypothetical protein